MNGKRDCAFFRGIDALQVQGYKESDIVAIMGVQKDESNTVLDLINKIHEKQEPSNICSESPPSGKESLSNVNQESLPAQDLTKSPALLGEKKKLQATQKLPKVSTKKEKEGKKTMRGKTIRYPHLSDMTVCRGDYILARLLLSKGSLSQDELGDIWGIWQEKHRGNRLLNTLIETELISTKIAQRLEVRVKRHLEKPESESTLAKLDKMLCRLAVKKGLLDPEFLNQYQKNKPIKPGPPGTLSVAQALIKDGYLKPEIFSDLKTSAENTLYTCRFKSLLKGNKQKKSTSRIVGETTPASGVPQKTGTVPDRSSIPESVIAVKAVTDIRKGKDLKPREKKRSTDPIPEDFGNYKILEEVAVGGMGTVYKALQKGLDRVVALKVLRHQEEDHDRIKRFEREANAVSRLNHPNIVRIHEIGTFQGRHFFSMDFIDGIPLDVLIKEADVEFDDLIQVGIEISEAVHYAHMQGVIHRDLKPANIIVDMDGHPQITDFGLAKITDSETMLTKSDTILGTPYYMAPEQTRGESKKIGCRTDVWGLGVILYEMVTGTLPFKAQSTIELYHRINHMDPVPPKELCPNISDDLQNIILKSIEKDPTHRYPNANALAEDLRRYLEGKSILAKRIPEWRKNLRKIVQHRRFLDMVAGALLLIVGSIGLYFFYIYLNSNSQPTPKNTVNNRAPDNPVKVSILKENISVVRSYIESAMKSKEVEDYSKALESIEMALKILNSYSDATLSSEIEKKWKHDTLIQVYLERARIYQRIASSTDTKENRKVEYYKKAHSDIAEALAISPNNIESILLRASIYFQENRIDLSIKDYDLIIQINPNYKEAYMGRALVKMSLKKHRDAVDDYERAVIVAPNDSKLRIYCAKAYMEYAKDDPSNKIYHLHRALYHLDNSIENDFGNTFEPLSLRGDIYYMLNEYKKAISDWGAAIMANSGANFEKERELREKIERANSLINNKKPK